MSLTQQQLESSLWSAANALRGPVDPADFKNYVFPVLFWKWLSDTHDYNHDLAVAEWGDDLTDEIEADFQPFRIPGEHHWDVVARSTQARKGLRVRTAMDSIAQANPETLRGVFGDAAFANEDRVPRPALDALLNAFDKLTLNPRQVTGDMLGAAYEYLLEKFADSSGQKAGEFFTPRSVVHMLVDILDPQPGESVYDPACGSGGMLVETVHAITAAGGDPRAVHLHGQEVNLTTSAIARMNLFLHGIEDHDIVRGDTLRNPAHRTAAGELQTFDKVIANPPFSLQAWGADVWSADKFGRAFCGVPPAQNGDYAWVQHMITSLKPTGRAAVVLPHGVLFRGGKEAAIRKCILDKDQVEAVIGLAPNLFYATTIPVCILVLRKSKPDERKRKVVFIDASKRFQPGKNRNDLNETDVKAIHAAYHQGKDIDGEDGLSLRMVDLDEIKANDYDLNIGRYVTTTITGDEATVKDTLAAWMTARADREQAEEALLTRIADAGFGVEDDE
jgi:type I restriction enzyme M protein